MIENGRNRVGYILIAVLLALSFVMGLFGLIVQQSVRDRKSLRTQLYVNQTMLLCDVGIQRALRRLRDDENYRGEELQLDVPEWEGRKAAVAIEVRHIEGKSRTIQATAIYQISDVESNRIMRSVQLEQPFPTFPIDKEQSNASNETTK